MIPSPPPDITPGTALFLDFDGTLAPIQDDPDTVALVPGMAPVLLDLARYLEAALAVISGRAARDLATRVPDGLWRIGAHGLEVCAPGQTVAHTAGAPPELAAALDTLVAAHPGAWLEQKGEVLAVHYRQAPDAGPVLLEGTQAIIAGLEGYLVQHGKCVIEAKPERANKGRALAEAMDHPPFAGRTPLMVGDDTTDEDAFQAAISLGGSAVKVGAGETAAPYRLADPAAVAHWLAQAVEVA